MFIVHVDTDSFHLWVLYKSDLRISTEETIQELLEINNYKPRTTKSSIFYHISYIRERFTGTVV